MRQTTKKLMVAIGLLLSISQVSLAQSTDSLATNIGSHDSIDKVVSNFGILKNKKTIITIIEKDVLNFENKAQVFLKFNDNSLSGNSVLFKNESTGEIITSTIVNDMLLVTLKNNETYNCIVESNSEIIDRIETKKFVVGSPLSLTDNLFNALSMDNNFLTDKKLIFTAMDDNKEVS